MTQQPHQTQPHVPATDRASLASHAEPDVELPMKPNALLPVFLGLSMLALGAVVGDAYARFGEPHPDMASVPPAPPPAPLVEPTPAAALSRTEAPPASAEAARDAGRRPPPRRGQPARARTAAPATQRALKHAPAQTADTATPGRAHEDRGSRHEPVHKAVTATPSPTTPALRADSLPWAHLRTADSASSKAPPATTTKNTSADLSKRTAVTAEAAPRDAAPEPPPPNGQPAPVAALGFTPETPEDADQALLDRMGDPAQEERAMRAYGDQVRNLVRDFYSGRARACFESRSRNNEGLRGKVVVTVTLGASGYPDATEVQYNNTGDPLLGRCLVGRISTWRFPAPPEAGVQLALPFRY